MLLEINKIAKQNNATFIIMLIPTNIQNYDEDWNDYKKFFGDKVNRDNPQEELLKFCNENNLRCLDIKEDYAGKRELIFGIDKHWNEKGHKLASEILYDYLTEGGLIE